MNSIIYDLNYWTNKQVPKNKYNSEQIKLKATIKVQERTKANINNNNYQSKTNGIDVLQYTTHMTNVLPPTKKIFIKYGTTYSATHRQSTPNLSLELVIVVMQQKKWFLNDDGRQQYPRKNHNRKETSNIFFKYLLCITLKTK